MFTKILVALDGSSHATKALKTAVEMAQRCDSELILFYALQVRSLRSDYEAIVSKSARDAYLEMGKKQRDEILSEAEKIAVDMGMSKVTRLCIEGEPARSILQAANETNSNLVVVGTRGLTGLREIALGSVARKVTSAAECPVLVVR